MDCHSSVHSKMQTFRHFFITCKTQKLGRDILNCRGEFWGSDACGAFKLFHNSFQRGRLPNRNVYSLSYTVVAADGHNDTGTLRFDSATSRAWIHTGARRQSSESSSDGEGPTAQMKKKPSKSKTFWVCDQCGESFGQWWGTCQSCKQVNTLKQFTEASVSGSSGGGAGARAAERRIGGLNRGTGDGDAKPGKGWFRGGGGSLTEFQPQRLSDVNNGRNEQLWRIPLSGLFGMEVARVLGGGLAPGSLVLIGGDPGVGKSTLLLQVGAMLAEGCELNGPAPVLYVSGEESVEQIGSRADRMRIDTNELFLYSSTDLEDILDKVHILCPRAVIVDSIQTVYLKEAPGSAGSITQVKECAMALLRCAKRTHIPIFLVGHVTKSGDIAGPRVLEHIVDVVLYMEGERLLSHRLLRAVKNRFGSTDEIGVLEMVKSGLQAVTNPSELYLGERNTDPEVLAGVAVTVTIDGSRPFLIETQALCSSGVSITRRFNGVKESRADMIIAVLIKQAGLKLQDSAIYLNVVGGVRLEETAADLAIAASICSSFLEIPIPCDMAFIGEIGLGGELRTIGRMDRRINELAKLGFTKCIIPKSTEKSINGLAWEGISIISCKNVKEVINTIFQNPSIL
eukprot:Gb_17819 [translate_table: standard]